MKTYIFYYRTLLFDGDTLKINASDIRKAIKGLCQFFFEHGIVPYDLYLSCNYQVYSNGRFSRRKLNDRHYSYLSAFIKNIVDINFYGEVLDDKI